MSQLMVCDRFRRNASLIEMNDVKKLESDASWLFELEKRLFRMHEPETEQRV